MFADSLIEISGRERDHRRFTALISFALQALTLTMLIPVPLFHNQRLPLIFSASSLTVPAPSPAPPVHTQRSRVSARSVSNMIAGHMLPPSQIPRAVMMADDTVAPPVQIYTSGSVVPDGSGSGSGNVPWAIGDTTSVSLPAPPPPSQVRVSRMMEGNLVHRIQPSYPEIARQARVQGAVVLGAVISKDGRIENLRVLRGHPLLAKAAIDAVSQWRYRPYYLNGEPVEVETQVTVEFQLSAP